MPPPADRPLAGPSRGRRVPDAPRVVTEPAGDDVTRLLGDLRDGRDGAAEALFELVYDELYRQARWQMQKQPGGHTLQATALVNEAYVKLLGRKQSTWQNRSHFLAVAAKAMRSILVDHARGKQRQKRKAGEHRIPLDYAVEAFEVKARDLVALDDALERLGEMDPQLAKVVELRFFGNMTVPEVAEVLGVSTRTVERNWAAARAWLHGEIHEA